MENGTWRKFAPYINPDPHGALALLSAQQPDFTFALAKSSVSLSLYDYDYSALAQHQSLASTRPNLHIMSTAFPAPDAVYYTGIILSPKGRDLARAQLWSLAQSLIPGGRIYIMGGNNEGIKSIIDDASQLFEGVHLLMNKHRVRLAEGLQPAHRPAYPADWATAPTQPQTQQWETPAGPLKVGVMPGVFGWHGLDEGTALLLAQPELMQKATGAAVLDVGCGTGVIGAALAPYAATVHCTDSNLLAVACAQYTQHINQLEQMTVSAGDVYNALAGQSFDLIVSNPPFHQGFALSQMAAHTLIMQAPQYLRPGGSLILVANAFLPYETLLRDALGQVRTLAQNNRYKILSAQRPA